MVRSIQSDPDVTDVCPSNSVSSPVEMAVSHPMHKTAHDCVHECNIPEHVAHDIGIYQSAYDFICLLDGVGLRHTEFA